MHKRRHVEHGGHRDRRMDLLNLHAASRSADPEARELDDQIRRCT
jgi:hypothetical protein